MLEVVTGVTLTVYGKFWLVATTGVGDTVVGGGGGVVSGVVSVTNDAGKRSVAPLSVSGDATGSVIDPIYTVELLPPRTEPASVLLAASAPTTLN